MADQYEKDDAEHTADQYEKDGTAAAALPPVETEVDETPPAEAPPPGSDALPTVARKISTPAQVETPADQPVGESEARVTSSGSKSIAENLRELKEKQEMQVKERAELAKKQEENESALRCLREKVLKHEKEQLDLERKRKAMVAKEGLTSRKMAMLEISREWWRR